MIYYVILFHIINLRCPRRCATAENRAKKEAVHFEDPGKRGKLSGSHSRSHAEERSGALDRRSALYRLLKPSISRAVGLLRDNGYVSIDQNGLLGLTESGLKIAETIYERHTVLTSFLTALGVDSEIAAEDACRIEHVLSPETFDKLKAHAKEYIEENRSKLCRTDRLLDCRKTIVLPTICVLTALRAAKHGRKKVPIQKLFSLSAYKNRGTRPRFLSLCFAKCILCALSRDSS